MVLEKLSVEGIRVAEINSEEPDFLGLLTECFVQARESLLHMSSGTVATLLYFENKIQIGTRQRLSRDDVEFIIARLNSLAAAFSGSRADLSEPAVHINGDSTEDYVYDNENRNRGQEVTFPLYLQERPLGVIYIESLDMERNLRLGKFIREFKTDFSSGITTLWNYYRRQKEQFQSLISATIEGVIFCTMALDIQFVNRSALRLLGGSVRTQWTGRPLSELNSPFLTEFLEEGIAGGLNQISRVAELPGNRVKLLGVHIELLKDSNFQEIGWMLVVRDITPNWHNERLQNALTTASHEITTPLSSISGVLDLLLKQEIGGLNDKQKRCLEIIQDDIDRLRRLLSETLDLARLQQSIRFEDRRKETSLALVADKVANLLEPLAQDKNIEIELEISKALPNLKLDRDRLQQVLFNLVENGLKYSRPNGKVKVAGRLDVDYVETTVADGGVGIPEAKQKRIFERFQQLQNSPDHHAQGHGLGLSIAREIVQDAGGKIWVESEVGKGSVFHFTIPV